MPEDLYCLACKKKFSNAPSFDNHLKSAKHKANEKKQGIKKATVKTCLTRNPQDPFERIEQLKKSERVEDRLEALICCLEKSISHYIYIYLGVGCN
ncbi:hypothetical protein BY458DRAFT_333963 [Sporodiniella umbellata]|nr:hypothetical protein BY458DRAFT_333963 [Sporodiniella umbellata]